MPLNIINAAFSTSPLFEINSRDKNLSVVFVVFKFAACVWRAQKHTFINSVNFKQFLPISVEEIDYNDVKNAFLFVVNA